MVCELYLNKAVLKKKENLEGLVFPRIIIPGENLRHILASSDSIINMNVTRLQEEMGEKSCFVSPPSLENIKNNKVVITAATY